MQRPVAIVTTQQANRNVPARSDADLLTSQLFELLRYDFKAAGLRGRDRTTRLHLPQGAAHTPAITAELEALELMLRAAVVSSFESRAAAYEDEVHACGNSHRSRPLCVEYAGWGLGGVEQCLSPPTSQTSPSQ